MNVAILCGLGTLFFFHHGLFKKNDFICDLYSIILEWWSTHMINVQFSKNEVSETISRPYIFSILLDSCL